MRDLRSFGSLRRLPGIFMLLVGVIALVVAGCSNDDSSTGAGGSSAIQPTTVDVAKQADIAALLPAGIRESGQLIVGVNVPYAPNEFKDSNGQIIGFDVDLMNAIGKVLGVTPVYKEADFDKIIPSIQAGTFNIGMSSFTDNKEREAQVDFVNYFSAGIQWAQQAGGNIDEQRLWQEGCGAVDYRRGHRRGTGKEQGVHRRREARHPDPEVHRPIGGDQRPGPRTRRRDVG